MPTDCYIDSGNYGSYKIYDKVEGRVRHIFAEVIVILLLFSPALLGIFVVSRVYAFCIFRQSSKCICGRAVNAVYRSL